MRSCAAAMSRSLSLLLVLALTRSPLVATIRINTDSLVSPSPRGIGAYVDVSKAGANKLMQNIPLTNLWEMQFFGTIAIGTPPQRLTVVFDTGSGALMVKGRECVLTSSSTGVRGATGRCQGPSPGYDATASTSHVPSFAPFYSGYGSGDAAGQSAYDAVTAGGFRAEHIWMSVATREAARFSGFKMDGIFGMAQQRLEGRVVDTFGSMCKHSPKMRCVFALFMTPKQNQPGSQLTIGGYDSTKMKQGSQWRSVPVVKLPGDDYYPYWTVEMRDFTLAGGPSLCQPPGRATVDNPLTPFFNKGPSCYGIVDSGTTFIGVPKDYWLKLRPTLTKNKHCELDMQAFDGSIKCRHAHRNQFPDLTFSFGGARAAEQAHFTLTGEEYVQCFTDGWCKPRLTMSSLDENDHLFVFGIFFIRKYYTMFDRETRHILFTEAAGFVPKDL